MSKNTAAIILAAGDGTRMKSRHSKVCCRVLFKPLLSWVLDACSSINITPENTCVVVSDSPKGVLELLPPAINTVVQPKRLGTGHAVMMATEFLTAAAARGITEVCVLCGDAPFISGEDLSLALALQREKKSVVTVLTSVLEDGGDYGRILRENGRLSAIVEKKNAVSGILNIKEVNSGAYWFSIDFLLKALPSLTPNTVTGELYLTDLVSLSKRFNGHGEAYVCQNQLTILGANDRMQLAALNQTAREQVFSKLYSQGVDIPVTDGVIISPDVTIGRDTSILPGCILQGKTVIGSGCTIGPNTQITDCVIGDDCNIDSSKLTQSRIGSGVKLGPYAQIRPDCVISDNVKIGNFVEVKNSTVGEKTSFAHLTYIGDSDFGSHINVGCGVVTVNYDGRGKYRTTVEDNCFIGCNSNLIAPVKVGEGAYVAAASTVTEDVAPDALAIGRVRLTHKPGGAIKYRKR